MTASDHTVRTRRGLTLFEVIIALSLSALIVVTARAMLLSTDRHSRTLRETTARRATAWERWITLREFAHQARLAGNDSVAIEGDSATATIATRCLRGFGWAANCRVQLQLRHDGTTCTLAADTPDGTIELGKLSANCRFLYLRDASLGGAWLGAWRLTGLRPAALGIVGGRDTTIVQLGPGV